MICSLASFGQGLAPLPEWQKAEPLQEIERVGKAGKPIMLYFSSVAIEPDKIDSSQNEKLKEFRTKISPVALIERYKSHIEFKEKFSKQLEIKVRDLQKAESSGESPLEFDFISLNSEMSKNNNLILEYDYPTIIGADQVPNAYQAKISEIASDRIKQSLIYPNSYDNKQFKRLEYSQCLYRAGDSIRF